MRHIESDFERIWISAENLEGKAVQWFAEFYSTHDIRAMTYNDVVNIMKTSYMSQMDAYDVSRRISILIQKKKIDHYIKEFNQYKSLLPQGSISESIFVGYFIQRLKPGIRREIRLRDPQTTAMAAQLAKQAEYCILPPIDLNTSGVVDFI